MAIIYVKQQKKNPRNGSVKYHPIVKSIRLVGEKEVARLLSDETTLNPKEAELALAQLEKVVIRLLKGGYSVKMGEWASFHTTVTSRGADTPKECNATQVKRVRVQCRFSRPFLREMQDTDFKLADELLTQPGRKAGE
ncbi:MAG: DNA-binding protein [Bacteroidaceae bacterium]|nr:DNA-binding protein [Bacteroidaceae bacterium]